jgi:hypothetical protein
VCTCEVGGNFQARISLDSRHDGRRTEMVKGGKGG